VIRRRVADGYGPVVARITPGIVSPPHTVLAPDEWRRLGRARRKDVPRSSHAEWVAPSDRPDPVATLEQQAASRLADIIGIRHGRMAESRFAYLRGAAAQMAWDVAHTPTTDIRVQACGDAHLLNFGMFASPDRRLVFDVNDFDETLPAPFEWDLKRLAASVLVAARDHGFTEASGRTAARRSVSAYREQMQRFAGMAFLDVWYSRIDVEASLLDAVESHATLRRRRRAVEKAKRHTSVAALAKLCDEVDGEYRIRSAPPLIVRVPVDEYPDTHDSLREAIARYEKTLSVERREVVNRHWFADYARKVVGVGSVGTEAFVLLLMGDRPDEPLFLQIKEAQESVLAPFAGDSVYEHQGERVVSGQRLMQAAGDPFLGWTTGVGSDGVTEKQYYVRQLRDMKGDMNIAAMDGAQLETYAGVCGWALARSHARTGRAPMIAGYLGNSDRFDRAIEQFAAAYADQNDSDHDRLADAVAAGSLPTLAGV
jgi:uncharacterized protein (DUF2252 family)